MLRIIALATGLLATTVVVAQQGGRAVSQANFNLAAGHAESDETKTDTLSLEGNLPFGQYFGISAGIRRQWQEVTDKAEQGEDSDILGGSAGFYARDYGRGVIGVEYGRSEISPETGADLNAEEYRGVFALYDRNFDLTFSRTDTEYSGDGVTPDTRHTARAELASYGGGNLRIGAGYGFMDAADDLDVTVAFQPGFSGNAVAFELGYSDTEVAGEVYSGRVVYYFGAPVPLIRRYREQLLP